MIKNLFKFICICLFSAAPFAYANGLSELVDDYIRHSADIAKWSEEQKSADEAAQEKISHEIKTLKTAKTALLTGFATLLNDENLSDEFFAQLAQKKDAAAPLRAEFYGCLRSLHEAFVSGKDANLKAVIDRSLERLKSLSLAASSAEKDRLVAAQKSAAAAMAKQLKRRLSAEELEQSDALVAARAQSDAAALSAAAESYAELLTYLRLNVHIFKSNFVFSTLDAQTLITAINDALPQWLITYVNVGKLALCALIFAVVYFGCRRLILRLLAALLERALPEHEREHNEHFFARLRRPVVALFFVYTLRLCALVFFYPAPVAPLALRAFALADVVLIAWMIITVFNGYGLLFITRAAAKSARRDAINLMIKIANYFIVAIAALFGAAALGFDVSAIIASLGIGGLAVALAAKDIIANFFASVMLHFDNAFSQGDWVKIGDTEGTVVEVGMRKTAVRTFDNSLVFVPNSQIMSSSVKNWSRRKLGRKIGLSIGLEYSCSAAQVSQILQDIRKMLENHPDIAQPARDNYAQLAQCGRRERVSMVSLDDLDGYKNTLFVYLDEFAASSINIYVYCFSKSIVWGEFLRVKEDVMLQIMRIVEANGAGFAFPSQSLYIEKMPPLG